MESPLLPNSRSWGPRRLSEAASPARGAADGLRSRLAWGLASRLVRAESDLRAQEQSLREQAAELSERAAALDAERERLDEQERRFRSLRLGGGVDELIEGVCARLEGWDRAAALIRDDLDAAVAAVTAAEQAVAAARPTTEPFTGDLVEVVELTGVLARVTAELIERERLVRRLAERLLERELLAERALTLAASMHERAASQAGH